MRRKIQRLVDIFAKFSLSGAMLAMMGLFLIVFVNSVRRYTLGKSFEWGEELPIYLAIFGVMFGMAAAYLQDRHIRFTILVGFISDKWTRFLYMIVDVVMVMNGVLLVFSGLAFAAKRGGVEASGIINMAKSISTATGIEGLVWFGYQYPYQLAMVLGGALLAVAALFKLILRVSEKPALAPT